MSFLGGLLGNMLGGNSEHQGVAQALLSQLQSGEGGGLSGLLQQFQNRGLSQQANSWVGTGENEPITPDQAEQGIGSDRLQELASRAGVSPGIARTALAAILPMVVDHLTPNGQVPDQQGLVQRISGFFRKSA